MKTILITGAKGMVGSALFKILTLNNNDEKFKNTNTYKVIGTTHQELDITNKKSLNDYLSKNPIDILINAAAYTNVDHAEDEIELSNFINAEGPKYLAEISLEKNIVLIHLSTDYVFNDNNKTGHSENDDPGINQINQYAKSKRLGEINVLENNKNAYIIRTSWVFGPQGKNFIDTMISLGTTKTELNIVEDEFGIPTYSIDIAKQIKYMLDNFNNYKPGIYHIINEGICNRFDEAKKIFETLKIPMHLNKIKLAYYSRKAKIPNYSLLLNNKLPKLQPWGKAIEEYINYKNKIENLI